MSVLPSRKLVKIEKKCNQILKNDNIKFVGVINSLGNLIAGGFKKRYSHDWYGESAKNDVHAIEVGSRYEKRL